MVASFGDRITEDFFHGRPSRRTQRIPTEIRAQALRKLDVLNAANTLDDLRSPPGNRLEALRGNLRGYRRIRINSQWRIVFRWEASDAHDVQIADYHD